MYSLPGSPELIFAFCHYESGGSYGYALIERGTRTRSRLAGGLALGYSVLDAIQSMAAIKTPDTTKVR